MDRPHATVTEAPPSVGPLYSTADVAQILHVAQRTVQVWIREGTLPAVRYGRLLRVREADLATFGERLNPRQADAVHADPPNE